MEHATLHTLFSRFLAGDNLSEQELQGLFDYFLLDGSRDQLRQLILEELEKGSDSLMKEDVSRFRQLADDVKAELRLQILGQRDKIKKPPIVRWWIRFSIAASVLISLGLGLFYYIGGEPEDANSLITNNNDIPPGRKRALLTLADGEVVDLDDVQGGVIAKQRGLRIEKQASGTLVYEQTDQIKGANEIGFNTVTTPRGGQYKVTLPDGTKVWLNAASSLTYPVDFQQAERVVELEGEAYFEVAKDHKRPFIVNSGKQSIRVLGTAFNVFAYADESSVVTTLVEGAVSLHYKGDNPTGKIAAGGQRLKPGEQAVWSLRGVSISNVSTAEYTAWKDGIISFQDKEFNTIIRQIERWYDVTFEPQEVTVNEKLSGMVFSDVQLSELLKALEVHTAIQFEIKGRRVIMQP